MALVLEIKLDAEVGVDQQTQSKVARFEINVFSFLLNFLALFYHRHPAVRKKSASTNI